MSTTIIPHINLETENLRNGELDVIKLSGREVISQIFHYEILAVCRDPSAVEPEELVGQEAALVYSRDGKTLGRVYGMISVVNDRLETETAHSTYRLTFVPRAYRLALVETLDVFLDINVPDVLRQKLTAAGLREKAAREAPPEGGSASLPLGQSKDGFDFEMRLYDSYPVRDFIVQYKETDLAFVSRLCEHVGISFFFEHSGGRDVLVFTDANEGFRVSEAGEGVPFRARGEHNDVYSFEETIRMIPAQYIIRDYNYRTPQVTLTGQAQAPIGLGSVVEYGSHVKTPDEAEKLAQVRAQERMAQRRIYEAKSDVPLLTAGARLAVLGHPRGDTKLLVTEVAVSAEQVTLGVASVKEAFFHADFKAVSQTRRYRPPRITPKPRIHGVVNGVIDSANDDHRYADVDEHGRYRVRFLFDTTDPDKGQASKLMRMAQPHVGEGFGMHFPLRAGVEVIVTFVDGDPDRPIIAAAVPNAQTASPVHVGNSPRNVIRTGAGNEINIDDTHDNARIKLSSPHKNTSFQLGSPNSPERGAMLETEGAWSNVALSGAASFTTLKADFAAIQKFVVSGSIHTVAEVPDFLEGVSSVAELVASAAETASAFVELAQGAKEFHLAQTKKASIDAQVTAQGSRETANDKRKERDTAGAALSTAIDTELAKTPPNALSQSDHDKLTALKDKIAAQQAADAAYEAELINLRSMEEMLRDAKVSGEYVGRTGYSIEYYEAQIEASKKKLYGDPIKEPPETPTSGLAATRNSAAAAVGMATAADGTVTCTLPTSGLSKDELDALEEKLKDYHDASVANANADSIAEADEANSDLAKKSYDAELEEAEHGDDAQNLKEAKVRLGQIKNVLVLFNDLMQIIALCKKLIERYKKAKPAQGKFWASVATAIKASFDPEADNLPPSPRAKLVKPKHTLGSEWDTEVYAENQLTLRADEDVKIDSKKAETVVASKKGTKVTSEAEVQILAKEGIKIDDQGANGKKLELISKILEATVENAVEVTSSKANVKLKAADKDVELEAKVKLDGKAKEIALTAGEKADLLAGAWGVKATKDQVVVGHHDDGYQLLLKDKTAYLGVKDAAQLQIEDTKARLVSAGELTLGGTTITIAAGSKVDFGGAEISSANLMVKKDIDLKFTALKTEIDAAATKATAAGTAADAAAKAAETARVVSLASEAAAKQAAADTKRALEKAKALKRGILDVISTK